MTNLMRSVMGAFAEFERTLIRERQREGTALPKQRGGYRWRKKTDSGISRETVYQYLRQAKLP